jgi:hypothetical protein
MPVIPILSGLKQEDLKYEVRLGYIADPISKKRRGENYIYQISPPLGI